MNLSVETMLLCIISAGFLSIIYSYFTGKHILSSSPGNAKMQEIASAIQVGAKAYLNRQYKTIAIVGVVFLLIIIYLFNGDDYQILFTASKKKRLVIKEISKRLNQRITLIGRINKYIKKNVIINGQQFKLVNNIGGYCHYFH